MTKVQAICQIREIPPALVFSSQCIRLKVTERRILRRPFLSLRRQMRGTAIGFGAPEPEYALKKGGPLVQKAREEPAQNVQ